MKIDQTDDGYEIKMPSNDETLAKQMTRWMIDEYSCVNIIHNRYYSAFVFFTQDKAIHFKMVWG